MPSSARSTTVGPVSRARHITPKVAGPSIAGILAVVAAMALGASIPQGLTLAFLIVFLVCTLPLLNARPVVWIGLAIAVTWLSRLVTTIGIAPRFLDFLDFPLALASIVVAGLSFLASGALTNRDARAIGRAMLLVSVVVVLSWAFSAPTEPQRLVAAWILTFEPFLLLMAVLVAPMTRAEWKSLLLLLIGLLGLQLPFSLGTMALGGVGDELKGTLLATGAGHHVSAGGLMVAFFILVGLRAPKVLLAVAGALSLIVLVMADAKQVLFALPLALFVLGIFVRSKKTAISALAGLFGGMIMATAAVYALVTFAASATAFDFIERSADNSAGKFAVAPALVADISESPKSWFLGLGPGETVSRFAYITTPEYMRPGTPASYLGMEPSTGPQKYQDIARGGAYTGESSFTSAQSSALGILGDYGVLGVAAFALLIGTILAALRRVPPERRGLAAAALASWTLLLPLAVIFDWLEQPPFTLSVMILTALALRAPDTLGTSAARTRGAHRAILDKIDRAEFDQRQPTSEPGHRSARAR